MKCTIFFLLAVALTRLANAQQKESFGIADFTVPKNWKKESYANSVTYSQVAADKTSWCQLTVFKPVASKGNLSGDFTSEWSEIVAQQHSLDAGPLTGTPKQLGSWSYITGSGSSAYNGSNMQIRLTTYSDTKNTFSIMARTNNADYWNAVDAFIQSVEIHAPGNSGNSQLQVSSPGNQGVSGYTFTVSNFDDGWVGSVMNDHVLVQRGESRVYLNFSLPYNASQFSGTGLNARDHYWDQVVSKLFTVQAKYYNDGGSVAMKPPYVEGLAVDRQTGKSCYIGMYLLIVPNAVNVVVGTAPNEAAYRKLFPQANDAFTSDLAAMTRYNKFALAQQDLTGKWQNGNTETAQWYYVSPAGYEGYAGMTLAATSATFIFNAGNTYSSIHNGATGSVGNMNTFQQEYKGTYSVSNWSVTATNRYGGKTDVFDAYFVAVRGGRILKLNNGAGQEYSLVRVK